jgi:hypothetical protein
MNTKLFHRKDRARLWKNNVNEIMKSDGMNASSFSQVKEKSFHDLKNLYFEPPPSQQVDITQLSNHIPQIINQQYNKYLLDPLEESKILKFIQQMGPDKASGPDGFSTHFYKIYWNTIKFDLVGMVRYVKKSSHMGGNTNSSFLYLVPKEVNPSWLSRFRPISLCTVS